MLNPQWLETFIKLAETGSFTRTAELLFMTQPGVSQHIKKLEDACESKLLVRLGKGIELTEQGQRVMAYARQLRTSETKLIDSLKFDELNEGRCVIGCSGALAQRIYPVLLQLQYEHPGLSIQLEVAPHRTILQGIAQSAVDLGVTTAQGDDEHFTNEQTGTEPLGLFLPANYQAEGDIVTTLMKLGLIQHPDVNHYLNLYFSHCGDAALAACDPAIFKRSGAINQLSQILLPVSKGLGFTVLPTSTLAYFGTPETLQIYPAVQQVAEPLYFVKSRHRQLAARYGTVKAALAKILQ
jgi:DNA-binding transcriptional LysR family regulator